jgi:hypothetical protein
VPCVHAHRRRGAARSRAARTSTTGRTAAAKQHIERARGADQLTAPQGRGLTPRPVAHVPRHRTPPPEWARTGQASTERALPGLDGRLPSPKRGAGGGRPAQDFRVSIYRRHRRSSWSTRTRAGSGLQMAAAPGLWARPAAGSLPGCGVDIIPCDFIVNGIIAVCDRPRSPASTTSSSGARTADVRASTGVGLLREALHLRPGCAAGDWTFGAEPIG